EFYDNRLVIFPTAGANPEARGVTFEHLPHAIYDRGQTRTNREEARAVAQAVLAHALETPHLTLGVAAFSVAQRDLIEVEVELQRRKHPEAEAYFTRHRHEPFFVKNLENIQGDERDVVFISVGYGRNEAGKIAKQFGPLLKDGGERRLNVLITRAKLAMRVFCNFKADDLELDAKDKHGVRALKSFLRYAETRKLEVARETGKAADSPFETEVLLALRERGYDVEPQVGTAGYFIDLAVKDPERPGRYVLAVECDGAAYHSSRSARDRDRLRQGVLEGLGWRFHRIWSTDWFRNRPGELTRLVEAIEAARQAPVDAPPQAVVPAAPTPHVIERADAPEDDEPTSAQRYEKAKLPPARGLPLQEAWVGDVAQLVLAVARVEAPVHVSDLTKRITEAYGIGRTGPRVQAAVQNAISHCCSQAKLVVRGDFVYMAGQAEIKVRDRADLPPSEKNLDLVSPEELDLALLDRARLGFTLSEPELIAAALSLLGFSRATQKATETLRARLEALVQSGKLVRSNERYSVASG
ncbi:MAG: DUF3320 domain-containing protein, partial [Candidatus Sericytochromatia bacterium]|nr:DUF3320 domain-containing protein [Candidatus Sericytochromatia bacterium]